MKKIEKIKNIFEIMGSSGENIHTGKLMDKINEIIENQNLVVDRLNQEVSQPEEERFAPYFDNDYRCPECQEELLVTCKHPLELYCTCCRRDINLGEMEEELTFVKETLPKRKTENNTEEWETMFDNLFYSSPSDLCVDKDELKALVRQLLSERSFSKEELETLKQIIETHDGHGVGYEALSDMEEKIDRLLSLSK